MNQKLDNIATIGALKLDQVGYNMANSFRQMRDPNFVPNPLIANNYDDIVRNVKNNPGLFDRPITKSQNRLKHGDVEGSIEKDIAAKIEEALDNDDEVLAEYYKQQLLSIIQEHNVSLNIGGSRKNKRTNKKRRTKRRKTNKKRRTKRRY